MPKLDGLALHPEDPRPFVASAAASVGLVFASGVAERDLSTLFIASALIGVGSRGVRWPLASIGLAAVGMWVSSAMTRSGAPASSALFVSSDLAVLALVAVMVWRGADRRFGVAAAAAGAAADLLQRTTRRLGALLDSAHDPLLLIDRAGKIQAASHSTRRVLGWDADRLVGKSVGSVLVQFDLAVLEALARDPAAETGWAGELDACHESGVRVPCDVTLGRMEPPAGEPDPEVFFLMHLTDLRPRRALELERLHSSKMESIGRLATGIAHEINTPTQYVGDNLRFLQRSLEAAPAALRAIESKLGMDATRDGACVDSLRVIRALCSEAPDAVSDALEGVDRIASIVQAMRNFSHPGTEGDACVALNDAVHDTLGVSRNEWKYVARVKTELDPELPRIAGSPSEINQVLLNLIVNAAHAIEEARDAGCAPSEPRGCITVSTRREGGYAELRVRDTGNGIPDEIRERIFDPFFTTKEVGKGTGQGLAIAHAIVHRHGGSIEYETRVGEGTTFRVRLPLEKPHPAG